MSWNLILDDSFTHADTVVGAAGSTTGVPTTPAVGAVNAWVDRAGGVAHIASNQLVLATPAISSYLLNDLYRSDISGNRDQRWLLTVPAGQTGWYTTAKVREVDTNNAYLFEIAPAGCNIYTIVAGTLTLISSNTLTLTDTHAFTFDLSAAGFSPTTLTATVTDTTTATTFGPFTVTDSTAAMQASGLTFALTQANPSKTITYSRAQAYNLAAGSTTIATDDANLVWNPAWKVTHTAASTINNCAALRFAVTGTTSIGITFDVSTLVAASVVASQYPAVEAIVNRDAAGTGTMTRYLLTSGTTTLTLATGLVSGATNTVEFRTVYLDPVTYDRFTTPANQVKITGITVDSGGATVAVTGQATDRGADLYCGGDSIFDGTEALSIGPTGPTFSGSDYVTVSDGCQSVPQLVADALGLECVNLCVGGTSLLSASSSMPPFFTSGSPTAATGQSWCNYWSGQSRLDGSNHLPARCKIFLCEHGQNDKVGGASDATLAAGIASWYTAARAAMPNADQWIVYYVTPQGYSQAACLTGFTSYGGTVTTHTMPHSGTVYYTCGNDPRAILIDTGAYGKYVTGSVPQGQAGSYGPWGTGTHLHAQGAARLAPLIVAAIQAAMSGGNTVISWIEG